MKYQIVLLLAKTGASIWLVNTKRGWLIDHPKKLEV
jgi:hypothetical protein